jgi:hypothetical protein
MKTPLALLLACVFPVAAFASERITIAVAHDLDIARQSETITVPWSEISSRMPGVLLQRIAVRNWKGESIPYQVTNVAPQSKDPEKKGIAYGDLVFQHDFAAGEKSAVFTVEKIDTVAPVFPTKVFARYVPERLDDFAWENDKVAHRTYGPALGAPAEPGSGKEVLVASGLDVWSKRVDYPIVDRWYNKGHDHYHTDQGEGMDMYQVGPTRGCGGTGIWDGKTLAVGRNYRSWKVIANGPIRAIFELTYDAWDAHGIQVSETKRFTVDAGHQLDRIESTFTVVSGSAATVNAAVGLNKNPADRGQEPKIEVVRDPALGLVAQWIEQKTNDSLGTAVLLTDVGATLAEDDRNLLAVARVASGQPLRYWAGAAWSRAGEITTKDAWEAYLRDFARRVQSPVRVTIAP